MISMRFDHVGVVVRDLDTMTAFFVALGFEVEGRTAVSGSWLEGMVAIEGAQVDLVVVAPPGGGSGRLELSAFRTPQRQGEPVALPADAFGYRHIAYEVSDVTEIVERARAAGYGTVGDVADYQDSYRLAYVRGPEGLIVEFAQPL